MWRHKQLPNVTYTMILVISESPKTPKRYAYTGFGDFWGPRQAQKAPKRYIYSGFGDSGCSKNAQTLRI